MLVKLVVAKQQGKEPILSRKYKNSSVTIDSFCFLITHKRLSIEAFESTIQNQTMHLNLKGQLY